MARSRSARSGAATGAGYPERGNRRHLGVASDAA